MVDTISPKPETRSKSEDIRIMKSAPKKSASLTTIQLLAFWLINIISGMSLAWLLHSSKTGEPIFLPFLIIIASSVSAFIFAYHLWNLISILLKNDIEYFQKKGILHK